MQSRKTVTDHAENQEIQAVVRYAQNILREVERSFVQKHQDSFFLRGCNLLEHSIDKNDYRQILYVKYCMAVLSDADNEAWQQLAECVAQQLLNVRNMHRWFLNEIEILLDMGLKSQMEAILVRMIELEQVEGVRMMLERGASAGDVDGYGTTALQKSRYEQFSKTTVLCKFLEENEKGKLDIYLCVIGNVCIQIRMLSSKVCMEIEYFDSLKCKYHSIDPIMMLNVQRLENHNTCYSSSYSGD